MARKSATMLAISLALFSGCPVRLSIAYFAALLVHIAAGMAAVTFGPYEPLPTEAFSLPHFSQDANRSGVVQLFEWQFKDVAEECRQFLGPHGFAGVQLSPITEHLLAVDGGADGDVNAEPPPPQPWPARYQPVSYRIASRLGDATAFADMTKVCNAAGVRVYVEVVLNHMAAPAVWLGLANVNDTAGESQLVRGTAGSRGDAGRRDYPAVPFVSGDFHKPCPHLLTHHDDNNNISRILSLDAHELRNCQLRDAGPDLDHSRPSVRSRQVALLDELIGLGVAGFRVAAAERLWPIDLKSIFMAVRRLNSEDFDFELEARPLFYMDVDDVTYAHVVSKTEYTSYGLVVEHLHAERLAESVRRQQLSALINWGPAMGFVQHQQAAVYVDSLRQQRALATKAMPTSGAVITYRQRQQYVLASAFMLLHPYGRFKLLMSSYRYNRRQWLEGPPAKAPTFVDKGDGGGGGVCAPESGWICEHRWPALRRLIALVNTLHELEDGVVNFQANGHDQIAFCRGHRAFVAFNSDPRRVFAAEVHTCLPAGIYCDVIGGERRTDGVSCSGQSVEVNEEGVAWIEVPPLGNDDEGDVVDEEDEVERYSVLAIYLQSKLIDDGEKDGDYTEAPPDDGEVEEEDGVTGEPEAEEAKDEEEEKLEEEAAGDDEAGPQSEPAETVKDEVETEPPKGEELAEESPKDQVELLSQETAVETTTIQVVGDITESDKKR